MSLTSCRIDLLQRLPYRIARGIAVNLITGCWEWTGQWSTGNGYGKIRIGKQCRVVHRVVYGILVCPLAAVDYTRQLDHLCRNRRCCNPAHLEPVTPKENTRRGHVARRDGVSLLNKIGA